MHLGDSVEQIIMRSLCAAGAALSVLRHLVPKLNDSDGTSTPLYARAMVGKYHGRLSPMTTALCVIAVDHECGHFWMTMPLPQLANMHHAKEHFALQVVFQVSHTTSMVYVSSSRHTEIRRLRRLVIVKNLTVCAVVDSTFVSILRRHVVVRRRSFQAEDPNKCRRKSLA